MPYSQSWLEEAGSVKLIIVELTVYDVVAATTKNIYLSNRAYATETSDIVCYPVVSGSVTFTESINDDNKISISYGDIEVRNVDGEFDSWLDITKFIWINRPVSLYYGDARWVTNNLVQIKTDFLQIFNGVVADIDSSNRDSLNFKFRDKKERLNNPLTEDKLGTFGSWGAGGQTNQDTIKPVVFGEPHNYEPLLIDPATIQYMFNSGTSELLIEIRDNGVPIFTNGTGVNGATVNLTAGTFTLNNPLVGDISVTSQGVKRSINLSTGAVLSTYSNNIANIIALITTQYGKPSEQTGIDGRLDPTTELDLPNLLAFSTANTQSIGLVVNERENLLQVCEFIAGSIGATLYFTRQGKLQLLRYGVPTSDPSVDITISDMIADTFSISNRTTVQAAFKIGYAKNWLVQSNLVTAIPQANKEMFAEEWLTVTSANTTNKALYRLTVEPNQIDTALVATADATAEANRLLSFYSVPRTTYTFKGTSKLLSLKLGQPVNLIYPRFGLNNGVTGQVVSLSPNWNKGTVNVGVLI